MEAREPLGSMESMKSKESMEVHEELAQNKRKTNAKQTQNKRKTNAGGIKIKWNSEIPES